MILFSCFVIYATETGLSSPIACVFVLIVVTEHVFLYYFLDLLLGFRLSSRLHL